MEKMFNSNISIEKMAAYLDGNLTKDEKANLTIQIEKDDNLSHFVSVYESINNSVENSINSESRDLQKPSSLNIDITKFDDKSLSVIKAYLDTEFSEHIAAKRQK